jgi:phenylalanyl-tRNA synthetase beta chain
MTISYQWLLNYLPKPLPVNDLSKILTSIGLEVEAVEAAEAIKGSLEGLVIGEVLSAEKHPNADKLKITTVNIGNGEPLKIVCGAPNVAAGQRVIVAPVGTTVHPVEGQPFLIKKAKIRGEESNGMICAEDEIGVGTDHDGIMVLSGDAPIGTSLKSYFNVPEPDYAIEIGLTPNRSDAMSHIGVARDICAYLSYHKKENHSVKLPITSLPAKSSQKDITVNIIAPEACPRYTGLVLTEIKVGASPEWLQQRLKTIGLRSINNVVDITNYVLHEYGQPLHAFDADKIKGNTVNVRFEKQGTAFASLDEKERKLNDNDLMICDDSEGMCIAGVFGGIHSGVTESTTTIFLESAYFDPTYIRRTSMFHGLRTDAATHFEKGVDINNVLPALKRAASLLVEYCGASVGSDIIDVYLRKLEVVIVTVAYDFINKLSGKNYSTEEVKTILQALQFEILSETNNELTLSVPTNKADIKYPADIVEEIVRIDGLDNITIPQRLNISLSPSKVNDRQYREKLSQLLCYEGFSEIVTNSIVNSKFYPGRNDLVQMMNSLSSELDVMRPSLLESGLEVIHYNCNRKNTDLALFEFGNTYLKSGDKFIEDSHLALFITGDVAVQQWNQKSVPSSLYYIKGVIDNLFKASGISDIKLSVENSNITWKFKNIKLCEASSVSDERLKLFDVKQEVFFADINWAAWVKAMSVNKIKYSEVPKFPEVKRDLAIILDKEVTYQEVQQATQQLKIEALQNFDLFDVFESEKLGANKKSYALSYTFQLQDRTLTDTEIEGMMNKLITEYKSKLQAQIRE